MMKKILTEWNEYLNEEVSFVQRLKNQLEKMGEWDVNKNVWRFIDNSKDPKDQHKITVNFSDPDKIKVFAGIGRLESNEETFYLRLGTTNEDLENIIKFIRVNAGFEAPEKKMHKPSEDPFKIDWNKYIRR